MVYLSLYRRQRPLNFGEMTGQEHVSRTLSHALARGQLAHAYLFCGPRGTGKTTTAKILARAVNCCNYPAPEPCGQCLPCRNIATGVSFDVIEMDAASNRGIDEIRELRERTRYASSESRFKVYIIDEAHMLTTEACNAFLKTLEEPPPGVIFILATTDPSRLPTTIVSRCQRFDFHLITSAQTRECLRRVAEQEGWAVEDEALNLISRLAEGSLRDALGLLEQSRAYGEEAISAEHVRSVTGVTRVEIIGSLIDALAAGNLEAGLSLLQQITYSGRDLPLLLRDLTFFFSRLLLSGAAVSQFAESHDGFDTILQRHRDSFSREALLEIIELLHQVSGELRYAHHPQFVLEVGLIRMLRILNRIRGKLEPSPEPASREAVYGGGKDQPHNVQDSHSGKDELRKTIAPGKAAMKDPLTAQADPDKVPVEPTARVPLEKIRPVDAAVRETAAAGVAPETPEDSEQIWARILAEVKKRQSSTHDYLKQAQSHSLQGELLVLAYPKDDEFTGERIKEENHRKLVEAVAGKHYARPLRVKITLTGAHTVNRTEQPDAGEVVTAEPTVVRESGNHNTNDRAEFKGALTLDDVVKLFPGKVINVQEKEDEKI